MKDDLVEKLIEVDELWPYYTLSDTTYYTSYPKIKFNSEFIEKYNRVMSEFVDLQIELEKLHEG